MEGIKALSFILWAPPKESLSEGDRKLYNKDEDFMHRSYTEQNRKRSCMKGSSLVPVVLSLVLALGCALLGNMRGLLYVPLAGMMLIPYLYNAGRFKVRLSCVQAVIIVTVACNIIVSQFTAMHFYENKPTREELNTEHHGEEVTITSIGAVPIWLSYVPPLFIVVHLAFACASLSVSYNAIDKL